MNDLSLDLHGLTVALHTEDDDLREFVKAYIDAREVDNPDAEVRIRANWHWGRAPRPDALDRPGSVVRRAGRGLRVGGGADDGSLRALWERVPGFPEMTMGVKMTGRTHCRLYLTVDCAYVPRGLGRKIEYLRPARADRKRNRLFFKLMYFMIHYPVAWHLERCRGWGLLHASAVLMPSGKAILLAGLGGVGKSSAGIALLSRPGARLISDNLIFHDEERVYACPEPVRLDASALEGMTAAGVEPERTGLPRTAHPKPTYRVGPAQRADAAAPAAIFFLRFGRESSIRPLDAARSAEMLASGNDLAREIKDYRPLTALLTMMAAERGRPEQAPRASLRRLLESSRSAVVTIGDGESIPETATRLAEAAETAAWVAR